MSSEDENGELSSLAVQILLLLLFLMLVHEVLLVSMFSNCVYDDVDIDVNDKSLSLQQSLLFVDDDDFVEEKGPSLVVGVVPAALVSDAVVAGSSSQSDDGG